LLSVFKNKFDTPSGPVAFTLQIGATVFAGGASLSMDNIVQKAKEALKQSKLKGPNTFVVIAN
jgi:hypothetical protein